jgi:hypothetical protein
MEHAQIIFSFFLCATKVYVKVFELNCFTIFFFLFPASYTIPQSMHNGLRMEQQGMLMKKYIEWENNWQMLLPIQEN